MKKNKVSIAGLMLMMILNTSLFSQIKDEDLFKLNQERFNIVTHKMDIIPGMWRPMFESEQVAWISPPWESREYIWLDFPEAIFVEGELLYVGHIDLRFPTQNPNERSAPWTKIENGIRYEQVMPNGISFGGEITKQEENIASLKLWITNGSNKELKDIMLQTCVFLDGIKEFNENTNDNKFVHVPDKGWMPLLEAMKMKTISDGFGVGWREMAKFVSDLPVVIAKSKIEDHLIGFTWFDNTRSFIGNTKHPCVHADPFYENLKPGESQTINGELIFFEGSIEEFEKMFRKKLKK